MAGNTSVVDIVTLGQQWASSMSFEAICEFWKITRDQLNRLRVVSGLPPRRSYRKKTPPFRPDDDEIAASEASCDLAPWVARQVTNYQVSWTLEAWSERQKSHNPVDFSIGPVALSQLPDDGQNMPPIEVD